MAKWLKRLLLALFLLMILINGLGYLYGRGLAHAMRRVAVFWKNDSLVVVSLTGGKVITHLLGMTNGRRVVATLDKPRLFIDFASTRMELRPDDFKKLDWRSIDGEALPAPSLHSKIDALYYRPEYSEWEGAHVMKAGEDGQPMKSDAVKDR
jgi:hypothetical protein